MYNVHRIQNSILIRVPITQLEPTYNCIENNLRHNNLPIPCILLYAIKINYYNYKCFKHFNTGILFKNGIE